ncbi:MAG: response regulator [Verrucomicrobiota bacterium JB023]|nr:response regulator [Verrucomicrobiota bacterium JB023]
MTDAITQPARVLVVDDEPTLRLGFTYALKTENHDVTSVPGGREALEQLKSAKFDVMILDLRMPDLDGIETLEMMKKKEVETNVILCSAHINTEAACRALELGCYDFLSKPVRPEDLRNSVQRLLHACDDDEHPLDCAIEMLRSHSPQEALNILRNQCAADNPRCEFWKEVSSIIARGEPISPDRLSPKFGSEIVPLLVHQESL